MEQNIQFINRCTHVWRMIYDKVNTSDKCHENLINNARTIRLPYIHNVSCTQKM